MYLLSVDAFIELKCEFFVLMHLINRVKKHKIHQSKLTMHVSLWSIFPLREADKCFKGP